MRINKTLSEKFLKSLWGIHSILVTTQEVFSFRKKWLVYLLETSPHSYLVPLWNTVCARVGLYPCTDDSWQSLQWDLADDPDVRANGTQLVLSHASVISSVTSYQGLTRSHPHCRWLFFWNLYDSRQRRIFHFFHASKNAKYLSIKNNSPLFFSYLFTSSSIALLLGTYSRWC